MCVSLMVLKPFTMSPSPSCRKVVTNDAWQLMHMAGGLAFWRSVKVWSSSINGEHTAL